MSVTLCVNNEIYKLHPFRCSGVFGDHGCWMLWSRSLVWSADFWEEDTNSHSICSKASINSCSRLLSNIFWHKIIKALQSTTQIELLREVGRCQVTRNQELLKKCLVYCTVFLLLFTCSTVMLNITLKWKWKLLKFSLLGFA